MVNGAKYFCSFAVLLVALAIIGAEAKVCPKGSAPNALGFCIKCRSNQYSVGGRNAKCVRCDDGTTPNKKQGACIPCPLNTYGVNGTCKACPKGTYSSLPGAIGEANCTACNYTTGIGYVPKAGVCNSYIVCSPNITSFFKFCGAGNCWNNTAQCCQDSKGKCGNTLIPRCFKGRGLDRTDGKCKLCAGGYFNDGSSAFNCKPCPAGTQAIAARTWCDPCGPLKYSPGGSQCLPCPKGTYSDTVRGLGATRCTKCSRRTLIAKWSSVFNCSDYIICQPGKFPKIGTCGPHRCFNNKLKCCVKKGLKKNQKPVCIGKKP